MERYVSGIYRFKHDTVNILFLGIVKGTLQYEQNQPMTSDSPSPDGWRYSPLFTVWNLFVKLYHFPTDSPQEKYFKSYEHDTGYDS